MTEPDPKQKLTLQRILIIAGVLVALLFAAGNIIGTWQDVDDAAPAAAPSEPNRP